MFVCVVSLSQPSSREWYLSYVKCLCVLSRYLSPVVENGIYLSIVENGVKCLCVLSRYLSPVVENGIYHMWSVCVCCLVISVQ